MHIQIKWHLMCQNKYESLKQWSSLFLYEVVINEITKSIKNCDRSAFYSTITFMTDNRES